jgi:hypothetical protein
MKVKERGKKQSIWKALAQNNGLRFQRPLGYQQPREQVGVLGIFQQSIFDKG